ncbi:MAG: hypothetical protein J6Q32_03355 [Clostridia bacterium]|nr:hypothetical protein [Clostridia bacterium]
MEELTNEQIIVESQPAAAEEGNGESTQKISLGKFKDVNALLGAYNSLQAEFTKRCQRLKELENTISGDKTIVPTEENKENIGNTEKSEIDKEEILKEYLQSVISSKGGARLLDSVGVSVKTPASKPKTIKEAGMLAKEIL